MDLFNRLLTYYQITEQEYNTRVENCDLFTILNPFQYMDNFKESIDLIEKHISLKNKIAVLGDYDVDGLTSTSIVVMALKERGVEPGFYIPSRYIDGYGINENRVDDLFKAGYKLIITTDNGISAFEPIKKARELGIDVLVVDHHTQQGTLLPEANAIVHHKVCHYGDTDISAGFLALLVSYGLTKKYDEYSAALAGLAVISDMMPMEGANLTLVNHLLNVLKEGKYPQFNYLLCGSSTLSMDKRMITSNKISFDIVSPLNGLGRMNIGLGNNNAVRFLISTDESEITKYYNYIMGISKQKKDRLRELRQTAVNSTSEIIDFRVLAKCEVGLIGALANNQMYSIKKPVIFFTESPVDPNVLVGSGRSLPYIDFYNIMSKFSKIYLSFGGHRNAFGLSIKAKDFIYLKECLIKEFNLMQLEKPQEKYIYISKDEINFESLDIINGFDPFGTNFKAPQFALYTNRKDLNLSQNGDHIYTKINKESVITYFNYDKKIDSDLDGELILGGELLFNEFKGYSSVHFNANTIVDSQIDKIIE
jgi:single-stranded-DNA-specific exonuclease